MHLWTQYRKKFIWLDIFENFFNYIWTICGITWFLSWFSNEMMVVLFMYNLAQITGLWARSMAWPFSVMLSDNTFLYEADYWAWLASVADHRPFHTCCTMSMLSIYALVIYSVFCVDVFLAGETLHIVFLLIFFYLEGLQWYFHILSILEVYQTCQLFLCSKLT